MTEDRSSLCRRIGSAVVQFLLIFSGLVALRYALRSVGVGV